MRFSFDSEQEMLRDMIRGALKRDVGIDKVRGWAETADFAPFNDFVGRNGWLGIGLEEDVGGQGGGMVEQALLFEELGRSAAPSGALLAAGGALAFISEIDGGLAKAPFLLEGGGNGVLALPAGRPVDMALTEVTQSGGLLSGVISLVLNAPAASHLVVPLPASDGLDLWLVDASIDQVRVTPRRLIDHTHQFGDVELSSASGVFIGCLTWAAATKANARMAVLLAAESLGLARRMLEMSVDYVSQRIQFGVPVGSFQAVKHSAAEALVDIEAMHSGVYYAAWALEHGEADGLMHAWVVKSFATEAAVRTADRALQLHGAIGYTWEYDLQLFYKRAKLNLELLGSPRKYRDRIADALALH